MGEKMKDLLNAAKGSVWDVVSDLVLPNLVSEVAEKIKHDYFEILLDYAIAVKQEEKKTYLVTGYVNLADMENPTVDVMILFYDTLEELSLRVLTFYNQMFYLGTNTEDSMSKIREDYNLDHAQTVMIREKLVRLGVLYDQNEMYRDENMENIAAFLENEQKKKRNNRLKIKRVRKNTSYRVTSYGRNFIRFFREQNFVPSSERDETEEE